MLTKRSREQRRHLLGRLLIGTWAARSSTHPGSNTSTTRSRGSLSDNRSVLSLDFLSAGSFDFVPLLQGGLARGRGGTAAAASVSVSVEDGPPRSSPRGRVSERVAARSGSSRVGRARLGAAAMAQLYHHSSGCSSLRFLSRGDVQALQREARCWPIRIGPDALGYLVDLTPRSAASYGCSSASSVRTAFAEVTNSFCS